MKRGKSPFRDLAEARRRETRAAMKRRRVARRAARAMSDPLAGAEAQIADTQRSIEEMHEAWQTELERWSCEFEHRVEEMRKQRELARMRELARIISLPLSAIVQSAATAASEAADDGAPRDLPVAIVRTKGMRAQLRSVVGVLRGVPRSIAAVPVRLARLYTIHLVDRFIRFLDRSTRDDE
jgi:hypothetical protein